VTTLPEKAPGPKSFLSAADVAEGLCSGTPRRRTRPTTAGTLRACARAFGARTADSADEVADAPAEGQVKAPASPPLTAACVASGRERRSCRRQAGLSRKQDRACTSARSGPPAAYMGPSRRAGAPPTRPRAPSSRSPAREGRPRTARTARRRRGGGNPGATPPIERSTRPSPPPFAVAESALCRAPGTPRTSFP
jgi:hypothetical protein